MHGSVKPFAQFRLVVYAIRFRNSSLSRDLYEHLLQEPISLFAWSLMNRVPAIQSWYVYNKCKLCLCRSHHWLSDWKVWTPTEAIQGWCSECPAVQVLAPLWRRWCSDHVSSPLTSLIQLTMSALLDVRFWQKVVSILEGRSLQECILRLALNKVDLGKFTLVGCQQEQSCANDVLLLAFFWKILQVEPRSSLPQQSQLRLHNLRALYTFGPPSCRICREHRACMLGDAI